MSGGVIESWVPIFVFTILFGLSMDYHLFILTRIKEARDRGLDSRAAVARGISVTSGTITSAASIMVVVFAVFVTFKFVFIQQLGLGLAVAVFIDATLIRSVLLPATMTLLGDWNWWLPRWLGWLPNVTIEGASRRATSSIPSRPRPRPDRCRPSTTSERSRPGPARGRGEARPGTPTDLPGPRQDLRHRRGGLGRHLDEGVARRPGRSPRPRSGDVLEGGLRRAGTAGSTSSSTASTDALLEKLLRDAWRATAPKKLRGLVPE